VKVYIDTNIVVAKTVATHEHHPNADQLLRQVQSRRWTPVISAHGIAEVYSVLTRAPYQPRMSPAQVWHMLQGSVLAWFEVETLNGKEYIDLIKECAAHGWTGGRIYDAIHIHIARKTHCSRMYTFNVPHFRQLAPDLTDRIMAP
jgi:predicted nucleic acid-binding protein